MGRKPSRWTNLPKGMRARVRPYGTYYFFDKGGKPRQEIPLGSDFVEAVKQWAELSQEAMPKGVCHTFVDAMDMYVIKELPNKASRTQSDNIKEMVHLRDFFGNPPAPLDEIQPIHIRQYMTWRVQKAKETAKAENVKRMERGLMPLAIKPDLGKVRANRDKALFSHIFNFARNEGMTAAANPCAGVKGYKESGRDVYVEDDLFKKVYQQACEPLREAMDLAYLTGQRPADVLRYSLQDIRDNNLTVRQGKTEKKLRIEISGELAVLVERIKARRKEIDKTKVVAMALIVKEDGTPLTASALRSRFDKARKLAGIDKATFQFRDLRAKAGTDKADSDDILAARKQLGHASVTMTEAYVRNRKGEKVKPTR
jgi:integrase